MTSSEIELARIVATLRKARDMINRYNDNLGYIVYTWDDVEFRDKFLVHSRDLAPLAWIVEKNLPTEKELDAAMDAGAMWAPYCVVSLKGNYGLALFFAGEEEEEGEEIPAYYRAIKRDIFECL